MAGIWMLVACLVLCGGVYANRDVKNLQTRIGRLEETNERLTDLLKEHKKTIKILSEQKAQPSHNGSVVAFYASRSYTNDVETADVLVFDRIWFNTGQYNPETGVFTCPVKGVYIFAYTAAVPMGNYLHVNLYKGPDAVSATNTPVNPYGYHSSSSTINVQCNAGEEVKIKVSATSGYFLGFDFSHFSGFLLLTV